MKSYQLQRPGRKLDPKYDTRTQHGLLTSIELKRAHYALVSAPVRVGSFLAIHKSKLTESDVNSIHLLFGDLGHISAPVPFGGEQAVIIHSTIRVPSCLRIQRRDGHVIKTESAVYKIYATFLRYTEGQVQAPCYSLTKGDYTNVISQNELIRLERGAA